MSIIFKSITPVMAALGNNNHLPETISKVFRLLLQKVKLSLERNKRKFMFVSVLLLFESWLIFRGKSVDVFLLYIYFFY